MKQQCNTQKQFSVAIIHITNKFKKTTNFNSIIMNELITYINKYDLDKEGYFHGYTPVDTTFIEVCTSIMNVIEETELGLLIQKNLSANNNTKISEKFNEVRKNISGIFNEKNCPSWDSYVLLLNKFLKLSKTISKRKKLNNRDIDDFNEIAETILQINTQLCIADSLLKHNQQKTIKFLY